MTVTRRNQEARRRKSMAVPCPVRPARWIEQRLAAEQEREFKSYLTRIARRACGEFSWRRGL